MLLIKFLGLSLMNRSVLLDLTSFLKIRRLGMICCIASLLSLHAIFLSIIVIFLHSKCPCVLEHVHWYMGACVNICVHLCMEVRSHYRCLSSGDIHQFLKESLTHLELAK